MPHFQGYEYALPVQLSEIASQEFLVEHIREQYGIDILFSENLDVPIGDTGRHTAVFVAPRQLEAIAEQEKTTDLAWDHECKSVHYGFYREFRVVPNVLPPSQIMHCLEGNPFRGTAATEDEAVRVAYQSWTAFMNGRDRERPKPRPDGFDPESAKRNISSLEQYGKFAVKAYEKWLEAQIGWAVDCNDQILQ